MTSKSLNHSWGIARLLSYRKERLYVVWCSHARQNVARVIRKAIQSDIRTDY